MNPTITEVGKETKALYHSHMERLQSWAYALLKKSEVYTKTDMIYLTKGGFWLTLGQIISSGSAFLLAIAFANLVPKETYGIYKYVLSIAGVLSAFTLTGLGTAITQSVARGFEGIMKDVFWINLKWNIGLIVGAIVGSVYYFINGNIVLSLSLLIIGIFAPLLSGFNLFASFLNGKKKFAETTVYWGVVNILSAFGIIGVLLVSSNILFILAAYFILHILLTAVFYFLTLHKNKPNLEKDPGIINYAQHLSLMNVLGTLTAHIDKILVFHYLGTAQLAIYSFAIAIPEQIRSLLKQINTLALPKFADKKILDIQKNINKKVWQLFFFITIITIFYIISAKYIFDILFPQYLESIFYSQLFAISLLGAINILPMSALQAKVQKKELYQINIFSSIFQIILMFLGLYFCGLLGLIASRIIGKVGIVVISIIIFKKIQTHS